MGSFTKTETMRRLRKIAAESRRVGGLHTGHRIEIGSRTLGTQHADTVQEALSKRFIEGDDLANHDNMDGASRDPEVQQHGAIVHMYISDPDPWNGGLVDVNTGWLGTPEHDPVLLDYNGRPRPELLETSDEQPA